MDRETKDPLSLCEEVEKELGIDTYAVNWPIGCGKEFRACHRDTSLLFNFHPVAGGGSGPFSWYKKSNQEANPM